MHAPGPLLAQGRDADIFEYEPGLVLRRARSGRAIAHEARIMQYLDERGYPVPRVEAVSDDGTSIVMERVDGPIMMDAMTKEPRGLRRAVDQLADLHDQLHAIDPPEWLPAIEGQAPDAIVHLDLHPLNVIITTHGPVVIDWPNAKRGEALFDVALTYVLLTCPDMPAPWIVRTAVQPLRSYIGKRFLRRYRDDPRLKPMIGLAAALKPLDPNISAREAAKMDRLRKRMDRSASTAPR